VEEVLAHRFTGRNRTLQFLVKWAGFGHEENKWLDEDDLTADGKFENSAVTAYWDKLAVEAGTHLVPASGRAAKPKLKALKFVPKHKLAKPEVAKSKAKRKSGSKRPAEVPAVDAAPSGKRRKYPKRSVAHKGAAPGE
jgi:hypothetical protein